MKLAMGSLLLIILLALSSVFPVLSTASSPLEQTVCQRQSVRTFTSENITEQQLLQVLNAAYGFWGDHRSVPLIGSDYSLALFPVNATGSYRYIPENNSIVVHDLTVNKETLRPSDENWPTDASVVLIVCWNQTKMNNQYLTAAEAGCLVQNVYLAAVSLNIGTCCVGGVSPSGLQTSLKLPSTIYPVLCMPLGYATFAYPQAAPNYSLMNGNLPVVQYSPLSFTETLSNMEFAHSWSSENISLQLLSQLLWAAYGYTNITRDWAGIHSYHRTTPDTFGAYPMVIYVSNATGTYRYLPDQLTPSSLPSHSVKEIVHGDVRQDIASACSNQVWAANAPTLFLVAYNSSFNGGNNGDGGRLPHGNIEISAGAVVQQLLLESSAWNLSANVVSSNLEEWNGTGAQQIRNVLGLESSMVPLYVMPIGVPTQPVHLLLTTEPNCPSYTKGQAITLGVNVFNQLNPPLNTTLTLTITGPGSYYYFDLQPINTAADVVREYSFTWTTPYTGGTYIVEVSLVPAQLTAYDAAWLGVA